MAFDFDIALKSFEEKIVVAGVSNAELPIFLKFAAVSIKDCKLSSTEFGKTMGYLVDTDIVLTIDYYGHLKKSRGFYDYFSTKNIVEKRQLKELKSIIVHFASIRIEDVAEVSDDINVIASFPKLKNEILIKRGFKK